MNEAVAETEDEEMKAMMDEIWAIRETMREAIRRATNKTTEVKIWQAVLEGMCRKLDAVEEKTRIQIKRETWESIEETLLLVTDEGLRKIWDMKEEAVKKMRKTIK